MFKWYVTRGYPLDKLIETTYAERVLLRDAFNDYIDMWKEAENAAERVGNTA